MKSIVVIHHSADFDGLFCREIARKFFGDKAEYIGWDYGDPIPARKWFNTETDGSPTTELYMLDISVDGLMDYPGLVWIDHHKSAMAKFSPDIRGYRIDGVAACRLAWQYFHTANYVRNPLLDPCMTLPEKQAFIDRKVSEPYAVRLAGEYDIWDKRDPNTDVFQSGLRSIDLTSQWGQLFRQDRPSIAEVQALADIGHSHDIIEPDGTVWPPIIYTLLANGRVLEYTNSEANASLMREVAFDLNWEGLRFLAINKPRGNSRTFAAGVKPEHDALLTFYWLRNKWRISLYGAPSKPELDLSTIAVKYGGGGHRQACGFECSKLPFFPESFDSTTDTLAHIRRVNWLVIDCARDLMSRAQRHDESKLKEPEKSGFDRLQALQLSKLVYGSEEYRACLRKEKPAIEHHYSVNPHHPEFYKYGVDDMSLIDVLEMLCDWKAASERMKDGGSILGSIKHNVVRFGMSTQLAHILIRTAVSLGWADAESADKLYWEIGGVPPKP